MLSAWYLVLGTLYLVSGSYGQSTKHKALSTGLKSETLPFFTPYQATLLFKKLKNIQRNPNFN